MFVTLWSQRSTRLGVRVRAKIFAPRSNYSNRVTSFQPHLAASPFSFTGFKKTFYLFRKSAPNLLNKRGDLDIQQCVHRIYN